MKNKKRRAALPDSIWLESKRFETGADKSAVEQWLKEIGLTK